ncbi:MAG: threonylcarbamoyl-AMP synthase [Melioribacteraceae bacterium]|nr:threonylcarbamoyl-AMP synthase [Melioribacteraceae bacterium]
MNCKSNKKKITIQSDSIDFSKELVPAAEALRSGELVIFPTETVYGVGASSENPEAIRKIFKAKKRLAGKPFAFHIGSWETFHQIAGEVTEVKIKILKKYWPGPITFLLNINNEKVGFRFPDNTVAIKFLNECKVPVVATSANISNQPSPINIEMTSGIWEDVAYAIDSGSTDYRGDSTVVDLSVSPPKCLREGIIKFE